MEIKEKKVSWLAKLLFGKRCLVPGYSRHLEFYQMQAEYSQRREDEFVESEIERLAQEQYDSYISEKQKRDLFVATLKNKEARLFCTPLIYQRTYPRCYYCYNEAIAKFIGGGINARIQERYNEMRSGTPSV